MKLHVRHEYPCSPERFWEMYWHDSFDAVLDANSDAKRELIEMKDEGGVLYRRLRFTPNRTLPKPVAKILGSDKLVYEQENFWHKADSIMKWKVLPTVLPGKIRAEGTFEVTPQGSGCVQEVRGDIEVNIRFIGGQVEKAVVEQVEKAYVKIAEAGRQWLKDHPQTSA